MCKYYEFILFKWVCCFCSRITVQNAQLKQKRKTENMIHNFADCNVFGLSFLFNRLENT